MKHDNIITIDLNVWTTQSKYAEEVGKRLNTISQQIKRNKEGKASATCPEYIEIEELGLILVKRDNC